MTLLALGCGSAQQTPAVTGPVATVSRLVDGDQIFIMEAWGAAPSDTVVAIAVGRPRVVLMRHGPPDNTGFAELRFGADAFDVNSDRDSVRVTLSPRPGLYGLEIHADAPLKPGAILTFKYAFHFSAPSGARARYGTTAALEEALFVGRLLDDGRVAVLPSSRPASDNLQAVLPADGTYVVAAPH